MTASQIAWRVWLPLGLVAAWEFWAAIGGLNPLFFPAPSAIAHDGWRLAWHGPLLRHVDATVVRTLIGFAGGSLVGLATGLLMGSSERIGWSIEPLISTLVSLPKLSLLPLLMLVLGIGELSRLFVIGAASFVVVALQTADAVRSIDADFVELARNYGAGKADLIRAVYVPAAMPHICTGLRLALGRALGMAIAVEIIGAPFGLGSLIWAGWQTFRIEQIYIGVFIAAALGASFHVAMRGLETLLVPWHRP